MNGKIKAEVEAERQRRLSEDAERLRRKLDKQETIADKLQDALNDPEHRRRLAQLKSDLELLTELKRQNDAQRSKQVYA